MREGEENTYGRRPIKTETDCASDATLAGTIRTEDHVKISSRAELSKIVGDKVFQLDTDDRAGYKPECGEQIRKKETPTNTEKSRTHRCREEE